MTTSAKCLPNCPTNRPTDFHEFNHNVAASIDELIDATPGAEAFVGIGITIEDREGETGVGVITSANGAFSVDSWQSVAVAVAHHCLSEMTKYSSGRSSRDPEVVTATMLRVFFSALRDFCKDKPLVPASENGATRVRVP